MLGSDALKLNKLQTSKPSEAAERRRKLRGVREGLQIKHIASHRRQISSFEQGASCGSFLGGRQRHQHQRRAFACGEGSSNVIALPAFILVNNTGFVDSCYLFDCIHPHTTWPHHTLLGDLQPESRK